MHIHKLLLEWQYFPEDYIIACTRPPKFSKTFVNLIFLCNCDIIKLQKVIHNTLTISLHLLPQFEQVGDVLSYALSLMASMPIICKQKSHCTQVVECLKFWP